MFNNTNKIIALHNQIKLIMDAYFPEAIEKESYFWFRCNICGDSKKSRIKKRGYILKDRNPWQFYCHNCSKSMSATTWMKQFFPSNYKLYLKSSMTQQEDTGIVKRTKTEVENNEKYNTKFFVPILKGKGKLFDLAINFCEKRLIPKSEWKNWFVATGGVYKNRLIIPAFNDKRKIYYYQGRKLYDWMEPKYITRQGNDLNAIYDYYIVDKTRPVIVLEGRIDGLFVENSIAVSGLRTNDKRLSGNYFLLDNDKPGKEKSFKLLEKGEYVFLWKKYLKENGIVNSIKDINDLVIELKRNEKFTFDELKKYFSNSIYDKVWLKI